MKVVTFVSTVLLGVTWISFKTFIWCCILNHIFVLLNTAKMLILILLDSQICHTPESVLMNQRVHCVHDFGLSYFDPIKAMSWITADYLQWAIYVKNVKRKSRVYTCVKKLAQKIFRASNPSLGKWQSIHFIFAFYPLSFAS